MKNINIEDLPLYSYVFSTTNAGLITFDIVFEPYNHSCKDLVELHVHEVMAILEIEQHIETGYIVKPSEVQRLHQAIVKRGGKVSPYSFGCSASVVIPNQRLTMLTCEMQDLAQEYKSITVPYKKYEPMSLAFDGPCLEVIQPITFDRFGGYRAEIDRALSLVQV